MASPWTSLIYYILARCIEEYISTEMVDNRADLRGEEEDLPPQQTLIGECLKTLKSS